MVVEKNADLIVSSNHDAELSAVVDTTGTAVSSDAALPLENSESVATSDSVVPATGGDLGGVPSSSDTLDIGRPQESSEVTPIALVLDDFASRLARLENQMLGVETALDRMNRSQEVLPAQLRTLMAKVDEVTTNVTEPRLRSVFNSLLLVHDLLDRMHKAAVDASDQEHANRYRAVLQQILRLFAENGLTEIGAVGSFDPDVHNALVMEPTDQAEKHLNIKQVYRKGFRSQRGLLRPTDVALWRFERPTSAESTQTDPSTVAPSSAE